MTNEISYLIPVFTADYNKVPVNFTYNMTIGSYSTSGSFMFITTTPAVKLKRKKHWTTGKTALQTLNTAFLPDTSKLNQFNITLNNTPQASQDLLKEEETTMEDNWKGIEQALTSTYQAGDCWPQQASSYGIHLNANPGHESQVMR
ncbi:unnamed protein product [Schistosoma margrebowiei]|uniref:Uncharacterized protein n=1 Tax=Schistosoma margrebowiei TaxID=48269 RepID=A0A3P8DVE9_9TREM|nr:unnamed protein product [Schistosoma margrebowiei]